MSDETKWAKGVELVQKLFADRAGGVKMPDKFRRYTIEHLFGDVWQGDELALQERSLVTCTALVALGREAAKELAEATLHDVRAEPNSACAIHW